MTWLDSPSPAEPHPPGKSGRCLAGFVLAGGRSARMGRNKALLPYSDTVLVLFIARTLEAVAGSVGLVGPPEQLSRLGLPVIPDLRPGHGPLAGIEAALAASSAEWNLVVACDMPGLSRPVLAGLAAAAKRSPADAVVAVSGQGPEPMCAAWRRSTALPVVRLALDEGRRKLHDVLSRLRIELWRPPGNDWAENVNTPADWRRHLAALASRTAAAPRDLTDERT